jgi:hypothetical protein
MAAGTSRAIRLIRFQRMPKIKGLQGLTHEELNEELANGARFVMFQYAISLLVVTFRRSSSIYFIRAGQGTGKHSAGFSLLTLALGWWGIPWGPIYSVSSLYNNLSGGKDVTDEVLFHLNTQTA